ncbi:unnamed protein product [Ophioblennius macclurei]
MFPFVLALLPLFITFRWFRERKRVSDKKDKYVFITGCDTGFGNLLAKHLDQLEFRVIAGCYTEKGEDELKKVASEDLVTVHLDVSDSKSVSKAAAHIKTVVGEKGLWAVVNNAGISTPSAPTDWLDIDDYKRMLDVNLVGVIDVTLSVLPLIKKAKGRVVNVSSVFGRITPVSGPYCVSKYGVESFCDGLRLNMTPFGVKVACIEPGFFKTNVTDGVLVTDNLKMLWGRLPEDVKEEYGEKYLDELIQNVESRFVQLSDSDLMKVVGCMEHAVAAVHPRVRYSPGWDAKLFWLPMSYMPSWFTHSFFVRNIPKPKMSVL